MRFDHWEVRLNAALDKHGRLPHEWGRQDCMMFVSDCVWALTQKDAAAPWRRTYDTEAGALRIVVEAGGFPALVDTALTRAGITFDRIAPSFAQRGDPCFIDVGRWLTDAAAVLNPVPALGAIGICAGADIAAKTIRGLERCQLAWASIAWAIR